MQITRETKLFLSASQSPSNFGATVYNALFAARGINSVYVPRVAPASAKALIDSVRALSVAGCSISMPLKSLVIPFLDHVDALASSTNSVNTIRNDQGKLFGANTDVSGITFALQGVTASSVLIYGAGAVVGSVAAALKMLGAKQIAVVARREDAARDSAKQHDISCPGSAQDVARSKEHFDLLINATPASYDKSATELFNLIDNVETVFDFALSPEPTPLIQKAQTLGKRAIIGAQMYKGQVQEQFKIYTGISVSIPEIEAAMAPALKVK